MTAEVGATYKWSFTVTDPDTGALIDPATKTVTVTLPDQTTTTISATKDSTGNYHADYVFTQEGLHSFAASTTGPVTFQTDYQNASKFRSIVGLAEARTYIGETDTSRDDILRQVMMALTEKIESIVGVCVPKRFVNETVIGSDAQVIRLRHAPLLTPTSVETIVSVWPGGPSWVTNQIIAYPATATLEVNSLWLPFWFGPWLATYTAGRAVVPQPIQLALKEAIFEFWATQRPYGVDQLAPGMDDTSRWEQALAAYDLPPHARSLLEQYELPGFA